MILPTEKAVKKFMLENGILKIRMYITAYVDDSGHQTWGYCKENKNSDYYLKQKCLSRKTKTFILN
jgi:hypothetical protein